MVIVLVSTSRAPEICGPCHGRGCGGSASDGLGWFVMLLVFFILFSFSIGFRSVLMMIIALNVCLVKDLGHLRS